ncbi:MAG: hypothetical protein Q4F11_10120 [Eubacteriales bacterium]|nr:hypothetical protein [Eubacteriales bacterium]
MMEWQKDKLLYYIGCLDRSSFGYGLEVGADIFSRHERDCSIAERDERHYQDLDQLLSFVHSIYEGESHATT